MKIILNGPVCRSSLLKALRAKRPDAVRDSGYQMMEMNLALVGAGFIGRSHALAIHAVNYVFPDCPVRAHPFILAENTSDRAREAARLLGFGQYTGNWKEAVDRADAVIIAVPSMLHASVAERAIEQKKPVLCEKPVGLSALEATRLSILAASAGVVNAVGFTYARLPLVRHAQALIQSGELGRVLHVRGRHFEDYLSDPNAPHSWRLSAASAGRYGALGDLGYHILAVLRALCGPIVELSGNVSTMVSERPARGMMLAVENEDYASALVRFESGASGTVETSRVAMGRKMDISFEIVCEGGTLVFDGERMNELRLYEAGQPGSSQGFRTVLANTDHPDYASFLPAPGHQLGFNDLKTIELHAFLKGIADGRPVTPDLGDAARISRICDAILDSSATGRRIADPENYEWQVA